MKDKLINNQEALQGKVGARGSIRENGCGIIAIYNAEIILENEDITFEDIQNKVNARPYVHTLLGGLWGINPCMVSRHFKKRGYRVKWKINLQKISKSANAYVILYLWKQNRKMGAHYQAAYYNHKKVLVATNRFCEYKDFESFHKADARIIAMVVMEIREGKINANI